MFKDRKNIYALLGRAWNVSRIYHCRSRKRNKNLALHMDYEWFSKFFQDVFLCIVLCIKILLIFQLWRRQNAYFQNSCFILPLFVNRNAFICVSILSSNNLTLHCLNWLWSNNIDILTLFKSFLSWLRIIRFDL